MLGREPVDLGSDSTDYLRGKDVLITGAGGSIGLELCRQALMRNPRSLILVGRGENSLFEALIELRPISEEKNIELRPMIGDVRDAALMGKIFEAAKPQIVFHAAAHKHVHFMERQPAEAVKTDGEAGVKRG